MNEHFTDRTRKVMRMAHGQASSMGQAWVAPEHILLGIIQEGGGIAANLLPTLANAELQEIRAAILRHAMTTPGGARTVDLPLSPLAANVVQYAQDEADQFKHGYVGTEHLLLGMLRESNGLAAQVLIGVFGVQLEQVRREVIDVLGRSLT